MTRRFIILLVAVILAALLVDSCADSSARRVPTVTATTKTTKRKSVSTNPFYAVTLRWSGITFPGQTGYFIYLNSSQIADVTASPYIVTGLSCGTSYTLGVAAHTSTGAAGTVQSTPYTTPACGGSGSTIFPLQVSSNGRYLEQANGTPFLLVGDSPQSDMGNLSVAKSAAYFADREAHGFNAIWANLLCEAYTACNADGLAYNNATSTPDNLAPFTAGNNSTGWTFGAGTPPANVNAAYFSQMQTEVAQANTDNLAVFLDPIPTDACSDGGGGTLIKTIEANGDGTVSTTDGDYRYGEYLGTEFNKSTYPNVVWQLGNDFTCYTTTVDDADVLSIANGIENTDPGSLMTNEICSTAMCGGGGSDEEGFTPLDDTTHNWTGVITINGSYTYAVTYGNDRRAYAQTPTKPMILTEANYEGQKLGGTEDGCGAGAAGDPTARNCRLQDWWTMTSGGSGQTYGGPCYGITNSTVLSSCDTAGATQLAAQATFLKTINWWTLAPDANGTGHLVTAGGGTCGTTGLFSGTNGTCVTAATNGTNLALIYMPNPTSLGTITVDTTKLTGSVTATWVDPADDAETPATSGGTPSAATFTPTGNNSVGDKDWVLMLQSSPTLYALPSNRTYDWNPGLNSTGGIPDASWPVVATLSPSGGDDTAAINNALATCSGDEVVLLNPGVYKLSGKGIGFSNSGCVLRGSGPGPGNWAAGTAATGTGGTYLEQGSGAVYPVISLAPFPGGTGTPTNLTVNATRGTSTATVASTAGLSTGQLVQLTEVNGNTTVAAGSNGINVNTFTSGSPGTVNVASTTNFSSSGGTINVADSGGTATLTYSGITSTTFTGVIFAGGNAGTMATAGVVLDTTVSHWQTVDPENNSGWFEQPNRPIGDTLKILSIAGNVVTFTTDLPITYNVSQTATLTPLNQQINNSGIENLYAYGGGGGDGGGGIHLYDCDQCWVSHVEDTWCSGGCIQDDYSFQNDIVDSYVHDSQGGLESGGSSYGVSLSYYTSDALIQDNIINNFDKDVVMRSAGGGNVWGYNYVDNGADLAGGYTEDVLDADHMTTPHYELFEGNRATNADTGDRWGNAIDITYFRNDLTGENSSFPGVAPVRAGALTQWDTNYSFVGNVLGTSGDSHITNYENLGGYPNTYEWGICYQNNETTTDNGVCAASVLRDGNYDYVSHEVHWHGIGGTGVGNGLTPPTASTLPASMYLTSKPTFFGTNTWPWVDGSNATTPVPGVLPAYQRFNDGVPNTLGG